VNRFIDHLYTRLGTKNNYSSTANLHNSQIITTPAKCAVFTSHSLTTVSNSEGSSASRVQVLSSQPSVQNWKLHQLCPLLIISRHGPHRKHSSSTVASKCCIINNLLPSNGNVFTEPLPRNGRCLQSHCLAMGLYAPICYFQRLVTTQHISCGRFNDAVSILTTQDQMVGLLMNDKLGRIWQDEALEWLRYCFAV
jgi:hypothetical protein